MSLFSRWNGQEMSRGNIHAIFRWAPPSEATLIELQFKIKIRSRPTIPTLCYCVSKMSTLDHPPKLNIRIQKGLWFKVNKIWKYQQYVFNPFIIRHYKHCSMLTKRESMRTTAISTHARYTYVHQQSSPPFRRYNYTEIDRGGLAACGQ